MIVDDDRTTAKLLQTLLELDGYDVNVVGAALMSSRWPSRPRLTFS
jgi:DNA-binding response OmpR family regulator